MAVAALTKRSWFKDAGLVLVVALLAILLSIAGHMKRPSANWPNTFLNRDNLFDNVATPMSVYAIMAVGMTVVIITSGIDISVGSTMGLCAILTAWTLQRLPFDAGPLTVWPIAVGLPLLLGLSCGLANGLLVVSLRLHPFIVTLGTLSIIRGLVNVLPPQKTMPVQPYKIPAAFTHGLMQQKLWGVEVMPLAIVLIVTALGALYLKMTVPGVQTYAIGGNEEAARLSGVRVNIVKVLAYVISGVCAGVAGMVSLGHYETASATTGLGYELNVVAAAVVGGASLAGGRGAAIGALMGALVIRLIENGIDIMLWNPEYQRIIIGAAIIVAVSLDRLGELIRRK